MNEDERDKAMRAAAFAHVRAMDRRLDGWTARDFAPGFIFDGKRVPLVNPQRGIFKPRQMKYLLSIKTHYPVPGRRVWYDDQRHVHEQIFQGDSSVTYAFMGEDPDAADNRWLREAFEQRIEIIYFLGVAPRRFMACYPCYVVGWNASSLSAEIAFVRPQATSDGLVYAQPDDTVERRYALRDTRQRLHQYSFRQAVIAAYGGRCALSKLPEPRLLDAAHIIEDGDRHWGQPVVQNGLPLSKLHHAAFDAHLIGIDPDYRLHVSRQLLDIEDGPTLEALKDLDGETIHLPARKRDWPDRDRLALRFAAFRERA